MFGIWFRSASREQLRGGRWDTTPEKVTNFGDPSRKPATSPRHYDWIFNYGDRGGVIKSETVAEMCSRKSFYQIFFSHSWKLSRNVIKWSVSRLTEEKRNQFLQSLAKQCDKSIFYLICEFILFRGRLMSSRVENKHNDTIHLKVVKLYVLPLLPLSCRVKPANWSKDSKIYKWLLLPKESVFDLVWLFSGYCFSGFFSVLVRAQHLPQIVLLTNAVRWEKIH